MKQCIRYFCWIPKNQHENLGTVIETAFGGDVAAEEYAEQFHRRNTSFMQGVVRVRDIEANETKDYEVTGKRIVVFTSKMP